MFCRPVRLNGPSKASSGSELGGDRMFLGRSSDSHRPARPRIWLSSAWRPLLHARLRGRRVDPRAAREPLHAEETEMKMMLGFQHLRERLSHLTHDA